MLAAAVVVLGVASAGQSPAAAATAGQQTFVIYLTDAERQVVGAGVINSVGTQTVLGRQDHPDGTFETQERYTFPEGDIFTSTAGRRTVSFNPEACVRLVTSTGTMQITGGRGQYEGATGGGTFLAYAVLRGVPTESGCAGPEQLISLVVYVTGEAALP